VNVEPVTLEGDTVGLEPAALHHVDGLWHAGRFPEVWDMRPYPVYSRDEMEAQIGAALVPRATPSGPIRVTPFVSAGTATSTTQFQVLP
jgi:hypothetical protein